jgi:hypothetical protein
LRTSVYDLLQRWNVLGEEITGSEVEIQYILTLTQGRDAEQDQLKTPFYDHFHFPEQSTEKTNLHTIRHIPNSKVFQNHNILQTYYKFKSFFNIIVYYLVDTEIFSNRCPLFIC